MGIDVIEFIKLIRDSFIGSDYIYTHGSCYQLFKILKSIYPSATPFYADGHVITKIDYKFYDITGEVDSTNYKPYKNEDSCHLNKFSLWDNAWECPNCDDIIPYSILTKKFARRI